MTFVAVPPRTYRVMSRRTQHGRYLRPALGPQRMPDFNDKTRAANDRPVRDRSGDNPQKCYPEAFGRADANRRAKPDNAAADQQDADPADQEKETVPREEESKKPPFYKRPIPMIILGVVLLTVIVGG